MSCKIDLKPCDSGSPICRLNPNVKEPYYYDQSSGQKRIFLNRECSNFKK